MARCPPQVTVFQHSMRQQSNRKASLGAKQLQVKTYQKPTKPLHVHALTQKTADSDPAVTILLTEHLVNTD